MDALRLFLERLVDRRGQMQSSHFIVGNWLACDSRLEHFAVVTYFPFLYLSLILSISVN